MSNKLNKSDALVIFAETMIVSWMMVGIMLILTALLIYFSGQMESLMCIEGFAVGMWIGMTIGDLFYPDISVKDGSILICMAVNFMTCCVYYFIGSMLI
ncbi:MAG: hypothetical protein WCS21_07745 [Lachnospiraceae bacterium]